MILDDEAVGRVLFYPRPESHGYSPVGIPTQTRSGNAEVCGYLHDNRSADTLMMLFHGNGEIASDYDSLVSLYTACGVSVWVVDYRGYGRSTGSPSISTMLRDAEVLLDDVPRIARLAGKAFRHIVVMGRSLGSASAIHLASTRPDSLDALILDSPYADGLALIHRLGGPALSRDSLQGFRDNIDMIRQCTLPTLIFHGTDDVIIPIAEARALHEACGSRVKRLVAIEGAGHNDLLLVGLEEYFREIKEHLARVPG